MVPVSDLVKVQREELQKTIYRKDQKRVVYVLADMAGGLESPAYAILGMEEKIEKMQLPKGYTINELYMNQPSNEDDYTVKWDGEWQITLEVFRDLGSCFCSGNYHYLHADCRLVPNFKTPMVMMVAIPFLNWNCLGTLVIRSVLSPQLHSSG